MDITKEVGLRIRCYRKQNRITQEKLTEICELHPTISDNWNEVKKTPPLKHFFE